jgi:peptide/nickel transport system substrate-binding protein
MSSLPRPWHLTLRTSLGFLLVAGAGALWLPAGVPARPEGAGESKAEGKKPARSEEEEEEGARPPKKLVRVDDEEGPKAPPARRPGAYPATDLRAAARDARHEKLKRLFRQLAVPHDVVRLKGFTRIKGDTGARSGEVWVEPIPVHVTNTKDLPRRLEVRLIDSSGNLLGKESPQRDSIEAVRYYEEIALDEVRELLGAGLESRPPTDPEYLSPYDQYVAAEQVLAAVVRFHESARERDVRQGPGWSGVEKELRKQLLDVALGELKELTAAQDWEGGFALTRRLVETYVRPDTAREDQERLAGRVATLVKEALKDRTLGEERQRELRRRFRRLEEQFPRSAALEPVRTALREQAQELLKRAKALEKEKKQAEALELVKLAEEADPNLHGLRTFRIELDTTYQVLRVGVRRLPRYLSPGLACTDTELRAVELLFESLVKASPDASGVVHYAPGLAEGRPKVIPLGREFKLPGRVVWSDGKDLTVGDLRYTVDEQLHRSHATGRAPVWGWGVRLGFAGESSRVRLHLERGYVDPLALMTFKILPRRDEPSVMSEEFAEHPVGTGPFHFDKVVRPERGTGLPYASFVASPAYGARPGKSGRPRIKEVRFYETPNPAKELSAGKVDLALDLTAKDVAELRKASGVMVPLPGPKTLNRRVYFLAVNHRKPALADANLRIALARAINRERLLDKHFRDPLGAEVHKSLNGPYPAGSWACNPDLRSRDEKTLDPYDPAMARAKRDRAKDARDVTLSLKYPKGEPGLEDTMAALCEQVTDTLKHKGKPTVKLQAEGVDPYELRKEVEVTHDYDLAYYHYDYPDETFWLMPLLGPNGRGRADNYLGYREGSLVGRVRESMGLRDFRQVKEYAHSIHRKLLEEEMPIIPLWQLDPLLAYRHGEEGVEVVPFDPLLVFTDADQWRVVRKK